MIILGVSLETEIGIFNNFPSNDFVSYYYGFGVTNPTRNTNRLPETVQSYLILLFHRASHLTICDAGC